MTLSGTELVQVTQVAATGAPAAATTLVSASDIAALAVSGPVSSTDNAVPRWDGTTGKIVQNSGVVIDDNNAIYGFVASIVTDATDTIGITQAAHGGRTLRTTSTDPVTVTFSNDLPVGAEGEIIQDEVGTVTFEAASGATIQNINSHTEISGQYGAIRWKVVTNAGGSSAVINIVGNTA